MPMEFVPLFLLPKSFFGKWYASRLRDLIWFVYDPISKALRL